MLNLVIEFVECDCFLLKSSLDSMFQGTFSKTPSLFCKRNSHMCLYIFFDQRHTCRGSEFFIDQMYTFRVASPRYMVMTYFMEIIFKFFTL